MMTFNWDRLKVFRRRPIASLSALGVISGLLVGLSSKLDEPLRATWARALRPGQQAVGMARQQGRRGWAYLEQVGANADRLQELELEVARLRAANRQLEGQTQWATQQLAQQAPVVNSTPLLRQRLVPVRVLGRQARAYLADRQMLDAGSASGVIQASFVVDQPGEAALEEPVALLDQGSDSRATAGQMVLAGSRVWGKVLEVGAHTSTVQRSHEKGYRDLVQLCRPQGVGFRVTARGVLVGSGEPQAQIEQIPITESVAVGDLVYTAAGEGVLPTPLLYGRVVRCERAAGATHWQVWMQPAVGRHERENLALVCPEANPARLK